MYSSWRGIYSNYVNLDKKRKFLAFELGPAPITLPTLCVMVELLLVDAGKKTGSPAPLSFYSISYCSLFSINLKVIMIKQGAYRMP